MRKWKDIPLWKDVTAKQWSDWKWQVRNRITDVDTLSHVPLDQRLESELEEKFLFALEARAKDIVGAAWEEKIVAGEKRWTLRLPESGGEAGSAWEIRAQEYHKLLQQTGSPGKKL